jgi:suppressor of ftsI
VKRFGVAAALALVLGGCHVGGDSPSVTGLPQEPEVRSTPLHAAAGIVLPEIQAVHGVATLELSTYIDPMNNLPTFVYDDDYGHAPTVRVKPGDTIVADLSDDLPNGPHMMGDVNLHFHGLTVSPLPPADDVLTMLAKPGTALHYVVKIPTTEPPGLYWYHAHVHGETNYEVGEGGMSGAIVVQGIERHLPALASMPEHVLIARELGVGAGDAMPVGAADAMPMRRVRAPQTPNRTPCGKLSAGQDITLNRNLEPTLQFRPGQAQFFRIVNATGHRHLDLQIDGTPLHVVAWDGYPLDTSLGQPATLTETHLVVPVAGRVEFYATPTAATELRTRCYFSGPVGDPDPEQILMHLRPEKTKAVTSTVTDADVARVVPLARVGPAASLPKPAANRVVNFTEDAKGFYINGKAYSPTAPPTFVVHTGTVERWTIENHTSEVHDFHLHQVHFLVIALDGQPVAHPLWRDTIPVPYRHRAGAAWRPGTATVIADFRNPIIRGTFLFHCHILDHEDAGMMAKIEAL